ncbi:MAG: GGDEF domain-containing protein [Clostridia bacterium]|nr:GGDEF domain-containing protein [Clostridia bacterium]
MTKRKSIAVLIAGVDREYQHALINGMAQAAKEADTDLCVFNCQGQPDGFVRDDQGERAIFDLARLADVDGAVVLLATIPTKACRDQIRQLLDDYPEIPLVTIDARHGKSVQVGFDDRTSVRELTEHLLDVHGARCFAVVSGPRESTLARTRAEWSLEVLRERGVNVPQEAVYDGRWVREGGLHAAEHFLEHLGELPDAIICGNNDMAFGVVEGLRSAGYRIPEDVLVTGFDARSEAVGRGLTTIRRPVREAGELAVRTLLDWIRHGRPQVDEVTLPTQIIYGNSCGCPYDVALAQGCVRQLSEEQRLTEKCLRQTTDFVTALATVSTLRGVADELNGFARAWNPREMHICVNPDYMHMETERFPAYYPDEMLLLSGWSFGAESPVMRFPTRNLLPRLTQQRDEPSALVFSPLSYMGSNLGYMVYDVEHVVSAVLPSLLLLMATSLMSISLRAAVQSYASVVERMSVQDPLTGLHNRRGMMKLMPPVFERAKAEGSPFAVVVCDMDDLKSINDRFGHLSGDKAIVRLGGAMRVLEQAGLTCVHISGDEFVAMGIPQKGENTQTLLETLRRSVENMNKNDPWLCEISVSMGAHVCIPDAEARMEELILAADNCMYAEKHLHHRRIGRQAEPNAYTE